MPVSHKAESLPFQIIGFIMPSTEPQEFDSSAEQQIGLAAPLQC